MKFLHEAFEDRLRNKCCIFGSGQSHDAPRGSGGSRGGPSKSNASGEKGGGNKARNNGLSDSDITSGAGWGNGADPNGPTVTRGAPGKVTNGNDASLPTGVTGMDQPAPPGATQYIGDPSLGQALGTVLGALAPAGMGVVNSLGNEGDLGTPTQGGFVGQGIDSMTGGTPGKQTGWSAPMDHGTPNGQASTQGARMAARPQGGAGRVFTDENPESSLAESLRQIISKPGAWPPVRPSAVG